MPESLGRTLLSKEAQLLICAARPVMDEKSRGRFLTILQSEIDWTELKTLVEHHRLEPLFWTHLKSCGLEFVTEDVSKHFENRFIVNVKSSFLFAKELHKILNTFEHEEIIIIPYKGIALAAKVYGNIVMRQSVDIDILICRRDTLRATEQLIKLGYEPAFQMRQHQLSAFMRSECDRVFINNELNVYLELHWAITPPYFSFPLETEDLIDSLQTYNLIERDVLTPPSEDLILILCVNATKEMWERLEWLAHFAQLVKQSENLNWERLIDKARNLRSLRMLLLGLYLAREVFEVDLPKKVLSLIKDDKSIEQLSENVYANLFNTDEKRNRQIKLNLFRLKARENWRDKIRYCLMRLFTPSRKDLKFINLPSELFWLYYFVRPIRLLTVLISNAVKVKSH